MVKITFEYRDEYSKGRWNKQTAICESLVQCKQFYGLYDCEHRIISIEKID